MAIRRTKQKKAVPASTTTLSPIPQSPAIRFSTSENGIGGGMYVGTTSNLTLRNSKLLNNDGATQGGAIVAYSAGTIELDGVSISENKAQSGAGIYGFVYCCLQHGHSPAERYGNRRQYGNNGYGGGIYANAIAKEPECHCRRTALSAAILLPAVQASLPISLARRLSMWIFSPVL